MNQKEESSWRFSDLNRRVISSIVGVIVDWVLLSLLDLRAAPQRTKTSKSTSIPIVVVCFSRIEYRNETTVVGGIDELLLLMLCICNHVWTRLIFGSVTTHICMCKCAFWHRRARNAHLYVHLFWNNTLTITTRRHVYKCMQKCRDTYSKFLNGNSSSQLAATVGTPLATKVRDNYSKFTMETPLGQHSSKY